MILFIKQMRRVGLAVVALGTIGLSGTAFAQNTASGTSIVNTATVNYTVSSIAQTPINASATFVVDTVINLNVTGGTTVNVTPGQANAVTVFTVTNTSNITSNFTLLPTNQAGDQFDMNQPPATGNPGYLVFVDSNANGTYEAGVDTATSITGLARNASATVFILGDVPATAANTNTAFARLTANAIDPGTSVAWVATGVGSVDNAATVQIVVRNNTAFAQDTYVVSSAALAVSKTSTVISDPFNLVSVNAKSIPGAVVEYAIAVSNTGAQPATLNSVSDPVPATTTFLPLQYSAGSRDVSIQVGAGAPTFCIAEAGGVDSNSDGCVRTGTTLTVGAPAITTVAAASSVTVRFRVTIN
jgi:uncharacterized repeat protein (TIGR01451 family)